MTESSSEPALLSLSTLANILHVTLHSARPRTSSTHALTAVKMFLNQLSGSVIRRRCISSSSQHLRLVCVKHVPIHNHVDWARAKQGQAVPLVCIAALFTRRRNEAREQTEI